MIKAEYSELLQQVMQRAEMFAKAKDETREVGQEHIVYAIWNLLKELNAGNSQLGDSEELKWCRDFFEKVPIEAATIEDKLTYAVQFNSPSSFDKMVQKEVQASINSWADANAGKKFGVDDMLVCLVTHPSDMLAFIFPSGAVEEGLTGNDPAEDVPAEDDVFMSVDDFEGIDEELPFGEDEDTTHETSTASVNTAEKPRYDWSTMPEMPVEAPAKPVADGEGRENLFKLTKMIRNLQNHLTSKVVGQDYAIKNLVEGIYKGEVSDIRKDNRRLPKASFVFAGSPGVGKTYLAETAADELWRYRHMKFFTFEMTRYSMPYQAGDFEELLCKIVEKNPKSILLFDEIEKADLNVLYLFLQILGSGTLRNGSVSFENTYIIFTTNAGRGLYNTSESGNFSTTPKKTIINALREERARNGSQVFPDALLSRFESGYVVMFNNLEAHFLQAIAKKTILTQSERQAEMTGVATEFDEKVFTALLFTEGGGVGGREVRGDADKFYNREYFELLRLLGEREDEVAENLAKVRFTLDYDHMTPEISKLFENPEKPGILFFGSVDAASAAKDSEGRYDLWQADSMEKANEILREKDIAMVLTDLNFGKKEADVAYLNIEDVDTEGRDFLTYMVENHSDIPVYTFIDSEKALSEDEKISLLGMGARDVLYPGAELAAQLDAICKEVYMQASMNHLAGRSSVLRFGTAQALSEDASEAEVRLIDFHLETAFDAKDTENLLTSRPDIRFKDVIGAEDAKDELKGFIQYLKNPKKYIGTEVKPPRGVLLYGRPGTGKTLLAKALAGETGANYYEYEGNSFLQRYVGEGEKMLHEAFNKARKYAPSIIFIDEIDTMAGNRADNGSGNKYREDLLTALLTEMDGFNTNVSKPVFVLAATNYGIDASEGKSIDPAVVRRFDRAIRVDLPNAEEREQFLRMQIEKMKGFAVSDDEVRNIAKRSIGKSLAQLMNILNLASRMVIRSGSTEITDAILEEAFQTTLYGEKTGWDEDTILRTSRHEAGHALQYWLSGHLAVYLTVEARSNFGGYMMRSEDEMRGTSTRSQILAEIRTALGGRASEIVFYGEEGIDTGATGDLQAATNDAERMITYYGMNKKFGLASGSRVADNDTMSSEVRAEVNRILDEQMEKTIELSRFYEKELDELAHLLAEKNYLGEEEIRRFFANVKKPEI